MKPIVHKFSSIFVATTLSLAVGSALAAKEEKKDEKKAAEKATQTEKNYQGAPSQLIPKPLNNPKLQKLLLSRQKNSLKPNKSSLSVALAVTACCAKERLVKP